MMLAFAERDSPRDQLVVTLFLLTVFGLLLGAGIKGRMVKAGLDTSLPWNTGGRKWWQVGVTDSEWSWRITYLAQSNYHFISCASGMDTRAIRGRHWPENAVVGFCKVEGTRELCRSFRGHG